MHKQDAASQNDLEIAKRDLAILKNKLAALDFQLKSNKLSTADKKWESMRKEGYANQNGIIFDTYFTKDEYIQPGQPIVSLLTAENIKVLFFIPEPKLNKILLNSKVTLFNAGEQIAVGTINYISKIAQYTPPIIYSREESHNLVFRVEARIDNPNLNKIHLGQPIYMEITS
jgi:HlyD family secretion protein